MRKIGARLSRMIVFAGLSLAVTSAGAAAQCWTGGQTGKGVPRESLLISNQAPFGVNVLAGPVDGVRRILGKVPPNTTMSFPAVLAPGRNEAVLWADAEDVTKHKLTAARLRGTINIVNRKNATCLRSAQLAVDATSFDLAKARNPGDLAPGAGNRNNKNATKPAQPPARSGAPR